MEYLGGVVLRRCILSTLSLMVILISIFPSSTSSAVQTISSSRQDQSEMFSTASDRFVYYVPFISKAQILDDRSISVARMIDSGTFERTSTYHVDFDRDAALAMGIAPDHVELANQMTNFTNDMLEYIETDDGLRQAFDFYTYAARYPQMIDYFTWIESNTIQL